jgi:hypothetical protein
MAAVLPQMGRNAVRACQDGQMGRPDRIGMRPAAGIPDGGDMINVDAKAQGLGFHRVVLA